MSDKKSWMLQVCRKNKFILELNHEEAWLLSYHATLDFSHLHYRQDAFYFS